MAHNKLIASKSFFDINPIVIGIDMSYSFVMKLAGGNILPITEDTAVNLLRLLEIEYHTFCRVINEMTDGLKTTESVRVTSDDFPFGIIVKVALSSERDYWIELSLPWLKEIGKNSFAEDIRNVQKNKHVSQRVRHLLLKL